MREKNPRSGMRRREFITLLSGAAVTWASAPRAQQPPVPVIGLLGSDAAPAQSEWTAAFLQRLRELGWNEGRNIIIDYRWGEGHSRAVQRNRSRIRPAKCHSHSHTQHPADARSKTGDVDVLWTELAEYVAARR